MNLRPATARSDAAIHNVWRLPATEAVRGWRALWWSVGPAGELAVLLVHRRHLVCSRYVKGWVGWGPEAPFSGELVTVTGEGQRRTPLENLPLRPRHLALLPVGLPEHPHRHGHHLEARTVRPVQSSLPFRCVAPLAQ
ncbi:hypothetical protein JCM4914_05440 [Streptomyces platensis subsp. malvinus]